MLVGVLGGGQLGQMLALAGLPLGLRFRFLDPSPDACAIAVGELQVGSYDDEAALARFAAGLDVVTYEFENVPVAAAAWLARRVPVFPPPAALEASQDRLTEKSLFRSLGVPTVPFEPVDKRADLTAALGRLGLPAVLKTRRFGYDGKGQAVIRTPADADAAWADLGGTPLILEGWAPFSRELSILAARARDGTVRCYPLVENWHAGGILRLSLAPATDGPGEPIGPMQTEAETYARAILDHLGYVGVLAVELFVVNGKLLANEMAPRVHNSGHWTIEGAETSQFEQQIRAVVGLPLGSTAPTGFSGMVNLIGDAPPLDALLNVDGAHVHLYGKAPRPGRKIGHVTVVGETSATRDRRVADVERILGRPAASP
jgi:5-(carboxyamino)imidazole ribonucleotide synthase